MKKIILVTILILALVFSILLTQTPVLDNFKLESSKYWGFFTINNNPLLKSLDKDITQTEIQPRISLDELRAGGPPKDGIPSIDNPKFININETPYDDQELIIGVHYNNISKAYPYSILNWHEIVNDDFNGEKITITYCPLCDTNTVFKSQVNNQTTTFGVSGKLYQSCLVMYDRLTDSLWVQPWGIGILGNETNKQLERIPAHRTTLGNWKTVYPETKVLSTDTGYPRDYFRYPYGDYYTSDNLIFPVKNQQLLTTHPKEIISYIWETDNKTPINQFSGESYFLVQSELKEIKQIQINNTKAIWDEDLQTIRFYQNNTEIPSNTAFGFVYPAFFQ